MKKVKSEHINAKAITNPYAALETLQHVRNLTVVECKDLWRD